MGHYPSDRVAAPAAGMSVQEGTVMFAWRYWLEKTLNTWCDMVSVPVTKEGIYPMRFEHMGGNSFTVYGGPDNGGNSVDIGFIGALDGAWHTFAMTWKDGETVKVYCDGAMCMETAATYNAAEYQLHSQITLGNRNPGDLNNIPGDYDYWMMNSSCLDNETIADYHANGYVFCGDSRAPFPPGDFDGDCHVNLLDFAILCANWLQCTDPQDPQCNP
jgi:hypothetical protein